MGGVVRHEDSDTARFQRRSLGLSPARHCLSLDTYY